MGRAWEEEFCGGGATSTLEEPYAQGESRHNGERSGHEQLVGTNRTKIGKKSIKPVHVRREGGDEMNEMIGGKGSE